MGNNQPSIDAHAFSLRLQVALDATPGVPALNEGRGAWLARTFKVTEGSANGWLTGRFMPKPDRVRKLAALTNSPYDWLYFGRGRREGQPQGAVSLGLTGINPDSVILAFRLAAEALGRDLYLPPAQHSELGMLILDLLQDGLEEAQVLHIARRTAAISQGGEDGPENDRRKDSSTAR